MKCADLIRVGHPTYGKGYVVSIANDRFMVKFSWRHKRIMFPVTAISDGTLGISNEGREQLRRRNEEILQIEKAGRERVARMKTADVC